MNVSPPVPKNLPVPAVERASTKRKPDGGPPELTEKHQALIRAMVWGVDDERVTGMTRRVLRIVDGERVSTERPLEKGEPLELHEAAQLVGVRQRNARELMSLPIFHKAFTQELQLLREGAKPLAMARIVELRDRHGTGKAADGKLQLAAAQAILGEAVGVRPAHVTVQNNFSAAAFMPGYVVDLSEDGRPSREVLATAAGTIIDIDTDGVDACL